MPNGKFSDQELYGFYKQVRNRLKKYEPNSLLNLIVEALHRATHGGVDVLRNYQPWDLLLLAKWTVQEADSVSHRRPPASLNDLHQLLNLIFDLQGHVRMPNEYGHINLFMRHLAFRQFWLQYSFDGVAIARQELLFCSLPVEHQFQRDFRRMTGLSCADFSELGWGLAAMFIGDQKRRVFHRENFLTLNADFCARALDPFLRTISRSLNELTELLSTQGEKKRSIMDQILLPTPMVYFPIWKRGDDYIPFSPTLLYRAVEQFIYRTLKKNNPSEFSARFGNIFQRYVNDCLRDAHLTPLDESSLTEMLGTGKCVDYLVRDRVCSVLIEAKGVEVSGLGRVAHEAEFVVQSIKASAVKAIRQGMDTARRLKANGQHNSSQTYLLVVTYDALHLGSNTDFTAMFGMKFIESLKMDFGDPLPIPIENVFFITIAELENLLAMIRENNTSWSQVMQRAQQNDSKPESHKFLFQQHLDSMGIQVKRLPRIQSAVDELCERCERRFIKQ